MYCAVFILYCVASKKKAWKTTLFDSLLLVGAASVSCSTLLPCFSLSAFCVTVLCQCCCTTISLFPFWFKKEAISSYSFSFYIFPHFLFFCLLVTLLPTAVNHFNTDTHTRARARAKPLKIK